MNDCVTYIENRAKYRDIGIRANIIRKNKERCNSTIRSVYHSEQTIADFGKEWDARHKEKANV